MAEPTLADVIEMMKAM
jgi:hypothetical protein